MRSRTPSRIPALWRCAAILLLFVQVVPAALACRCEAASGPMACCAPAGVEQQFVESSCCARGDNAPAIAPAACTRGEATASSWFAHPAPTVELAQPQQQVVHAFVELNLDDADAPRVARLAHAPPPAPHCERFLFCEVFLI